VEFHGGSVGVVVHLVDLVGLRNQQGDLTGAEVDGTILFQVGKA
jgi:hypothetical protein